MRVTVVVVVLLGVVLVLLVVVELVTVVGIIVVTVVVGWGAPPVGGMASVVTVLMTDGVVGLLVGLLIVMDCDELPVVELEKLTSFFVLEDEIIAVLKELLPFVFIVATFCSPNCVTFKNGELELLVVDAEVGATVVGEVGAIGEAGAVGATGAVGACNLLSVASLDPTLCL